MNIIYIGSQLRPMSICGQRWNVKCELETMLTLWDHRRRFASLSLKNLKHIFNKMLRANLIDS